MPFVAFKVKDISLAAWGRKVELAEAEMPGLMAFRIQRDEQPLAGSRIAGFAHDNPNCSLIETLWLLALK
jgi:adenosylhomocysteinase